MALLRNKKYFETEFFLKYLKLKSFKTYIITTIFMHLVAKLHKDKNLRCSFQARRQDLAAGGDKNQKERPKTRRGGAHLKIQYWMYVTTGGPNVKWGAQISNGGAGTTGPPAGDDPASFKAGIPNLFAISYHLGTRIINAYHFFQNN